MTFAVIQVEDIGLTKFQQPFIDQDKAILQFRGKDNPTIDSLHVNTGAITNVAGSIVRDIQGQRAVSGYVGQRHGCAAELCPGSGSRSEIRKRAIAVVEVTEHSMSQGRDEEIEPPVTIDICENRPTTNEVRRRDSGFTGDVLKAPIPEIPV